MQPARETKWTPAAWADAEPQVAPEADHPNGRRRLPLLVAAVVLLIGVAAAGFLVTSRSDDQPRKAAPSTTSIDFPRNWDPRIAPIAAQTAHLRQLDFLHPVQIQFLTQAQYTRKAASISDRTDLGTSERAALTTSVAIYRSVGLLSGEIDLYAAERQLADTGTLAFYDPTDKQVYIRGTKVTLAVQITLVHELTHVLQDQHFDLLAMEKAAAKAHGDPLAVRALVEGDAASVEEQAVDELEPSEKRIYVRAQAEQAASRDAKRLKTLPRVLLDAFAAPYDFGEQFVTLLRVQGGQAAVDKAFEHPPISFAEFWNPFNYLAGTRPLRVTRPALPKGAETVHVGQSGSLDTYLILSERLPPLVALDAADAWRGDQTLSYRLRGKVCTEIHMRAADASGATTLRNAWNIWTRAMPAGVATWKETGGNGVLIRSCDPGPDVSLQVTDAGDRALVYPVGRLQLAEAVLEETKKGTAVDMSPKATFCFADKVVRIAPADALSGDDADWKPDPVQQAAMNSARDACLAEFPT